LPIPPAPPYGPWHADGEPVTCSQPLGSPSRRESRCPRMSDDQSKTREDRWSELGVNGDVRWISQSPSATIQPCHAWLPGPGTRACPPQWGSANSGELRGGSLQRRLTSRTAVLLSAHLRVRRSLYRTADGCRDSLEVAPTLHECTVRQCDHFRLQIEPGCDANMWLLGSCVAVTHHPRLWEMCDIEHSNRSSPLSRRACFLRRGRRGR